MGLKLIVFFAAVHAMSIVTRSYPARCRCLRDTVKTTIRSIDSIYGRSTAHLAVDYRNNMWAADITVHTPPEMNIKAFLDKRKNFMYLVINGGCYKTENTTYMEKFFRESLPQCFLTAESRYIRRHTFGGATVTEWTLQGLSEVEAPLVNNSTIALSDSCIPVLQTISYNSREDQTIGVITKLYLDFQEDVDLDEDFVIPETCLDNATKLSNVIQSYDEKAYSEEEDY